MKAKLKQGQKLLIDAKLFTENWSNLVINTKQKVLNIKNVRYVRIASS